VEAVDRYTVRFTLSERSRWFSTWWRAPMAGAVVARECVEKWGDLKKAEAVIGTGPWMLESYRPNVSLTMVRHPGYFVAGLPYIDRVELGIDEDNASRMDPRSWPAAHDLAGVPARHQPPPTGCRSRTGSARTRPNLQTVEFASNVVNDTSRCAPIRSRGATCGAPGGPASRWDRKENHRGPRWRASANVHGPLPAALTDWALPIDRLGEGAKFLSPRSGRGQAPARRRPGYPSGFPGQRVLQLLRLDGAGRTPCSSCSSS
jgi:hypothetical protein